MNKYCVFLNTFLEMLSYKIIVLLGSIIVSNAFSERNFLENSLQYLKEDYAKIPGMQDFDPLTINKNFDWDEPLLKLHLSLEAFLSGFMNYEIHQALITPDLKIKLNATLEDTTFSGNYNLNGTYYKIMPLKGNGKVLIQLKKFNFYVDTQIAHKNGSMELLYYDMNYDFDKFEVSVSGLTGHSDVGEVIECFIRDLVPNALGKRREQIITIVKELTMTKGNNFLKHATLKTYIEIMKTLFVY